MNAAIDSDERWDVAATENPTVGMLKDAGLLLLVVLACPLAILLLGTPVVLFVRLLIEIAKRM